jgi:hypothetical protein
MSPGLKKNLKLLLVPLLIIAALMLWHFFSARLDPAVLDQMDTLQTYVVIGVAFLLGLAAVVFIFFYFFREIYTDTIHRRADKVLDVALDEENECLYVETDCYQSGADSGGGYFIYQYYLFNLKTGSKLVYKAKRAQRDPGKALAALYKKDLAAIPGLPRIKLAPGNPVETPSYKIEINPFKTRFDFGFEITCRSKKEANHGWKRKI